MIVVHGATGFTGGLASRVLARRGVSFGIAGRNPTKLESLAAELRGLTGAGPTIHVVPTLDDGPLDAMLADATVVINCVGPFVEYGMSVARAAVRNGTHYLDTTGEQAFMYDLEKSLNKPAVDAGVALCPGCAFEFSTGDCAAFLLAEQGVRHIAVGYATTGAESSQGTKKSIVRILSEPGRSLVGGTLVERKPGYRKYTVPVGDRQLSGVWIPGGECLTVRRHHPAVDTVETCIVMGSAVSNALNFASPILPATAGILRPLLYILIEQTNPNPHDQADRPARFTVVAFDTRHPDSRVQVVGEDPYTLTADVIVEAACRLAGQGAAVTGFTSPAALFEPRELMESVGCRVLDGVA